MLVKCGSDEVIEALTQMHHNGARMCFTKSEVCKCAALVTSLLTLSTHHLLSVQIQAMS